MDITSVIVIARHEARVNIRNKWTLTFAAAFGLLAVAISYFGLVTAGAVGFQGFERTTASLLSLVLYLIPNLALVLATLSFTGEPGSGELAAQSAGEAVYTGSAGDPGAADTVGRDVESRRGDACRYRIRHRGRTGAVR